MPYFWPETVSALIPPRRNPIQHWVKVEVFRRPSRRAIGAGNFPVQSIFVLILASNQFIGRLTRRLRVAQIYLYLVLLLLLLPVFTIAILLRLSYPALSRKQPQENKY
jgi:hypothetical protein